MNSQNIRIQSVTGHTLRRACAVVAAILLFGAQSSPAVTGSQKSFPTPEDAVHALAAAASASDTNALAAIFGPGYSDIESPDPVQAKNELSHFADSLSRSNYLDQAQPDRYILETGADRWPFPIPLVRTNGGWVFDTAAGKDEIIDRRIGRNELDTLKSVRAYVDAQREYASKDHSGNGVLKYAQKVDQYTRCQGWPVLAHG